MNKLLVRALSFAVVAGLSSAALADTALTSEVSLCQRDVMSQINLEHQHAKVDFNNKSVGVSTPTGNEVNVAGKGNFTKKDGTVKKFEYNCRVNTAEGRVINATVTKTGEK
jgi:2-methylaconitate cis-trans-isomerase PrpF